MKSICVLLILSILIGSCQSPNTDTSNEETMKLDMQGHRGARGLMPENTVPAFLEALKYGMTTLELDVVISKDNQVVVSHEPWMNAVICSKPNGDSLTEEEGKALSLYEMNYEDIQKYDCGSRGNPRFPEQQKMAVHKPLLRTVLDSVATYLAANELDPVYFNIETKSEEGNDGLYHPAPQEFVELLYKELSDIGVLKYTTIQSFDVRTLEVLHQLDSSVSTALLIWHDNPADHDFEKNLQTLSFQPSIYSCYFPYLTKEVVDKAHEMGISIIPWTVNETEDMKQLIDMGVDGLITDYPNRLAKLVE